MLISSFWLRVSEKKHTISWSVQLLWQLFFIVHLENSLQFLRVEENVLLISQQTVKNPEIFLQMIEKERKVVSLQITEAGTRLAPKCLLIVKICCLFILSCSTHFSDVYPSVSLQLRLFCRTIAALKGHRLPLMLFTTADSQKAPSSQVVTFSGTAEAVEVHLFVHLKFTHSHL